MHFCWRFIYLVSSYSTLCCVMACETYVRLLKSIKVQSFKIVKPCPQTPSLQDHALEPGACSNVRSMFVSRNRVQVCPHSSALPSTGPCVKWGWRHSEHHWPLGALPGHWQDWQDWLLPLLLGPISNMLRCFYLYLQVSGTVHSPHGFCPKHYCIFFLLYHSIGSSNIYIRSQGSVNILKCSAFLLLIMCAAGSARAGASPHPLSVRALTWLRHLCWSIINSW